MKIQIASDLHLELLQDAFPGERLITPAPGADFLVLAGDIANGLQAIEIFGDWPVPVLYLAGNHEFYGHDLEETRAELYKASLSSIVTFLDNTVAQFRGVRFLGTTLWTDYRLNVNHTQQHSMEYAQARLNDHFMIKSGGGLFTTQQALAEHETSRAWLSEHLSEHHHGKTVVITHHGVHPLSTHPRYIGQDLNPAFVSNLSQLLPKADLWIHGHVHDSFDYQVKGSRVIANPAGYAMNMSVVKNARDLVLENKEFQLDCVVEV